MKKKVVIVTVNYNQNDYTLKCVDSLLNSDYNNLKVILLDNGSEKKGFKLLKKSLPSDERLNLIRVDENVGYANGTNIGLKEGLIFEPDFFMLINNDTIVDKNCISELIKTSSTFNDKVIVTGKVYHYEDPNVLQIVGYEYLNEKTMSFRQLGMDEEDVGQHDEVQFRDMIDDIFVLQPVDIYKSIGGYSDYLWVNGVNIDMGIRAKRIGYPAVYTPNAKIWHKGSVSIGGRKMNPKLAYWNIQSSLILRYLYLERKYFMLYYITVIRSILGTFAKSLFVFVTKREKLFTYAYAKYKGLMYFNIWVFKRQKNDGRTPF